MTSVHIIVGRTTDFDDFLKEPIANKGHVQWPFPKNAKVNDIILFLIPSRHGSLCAVGKLMFKPSKSESTKYESTISSLEELTKPISIATLRADPNFGGWGYLNRAESYTTVPEKYVVHLMDLVDKAK